MKKFIAVLLTGLCLTSLNVQAGRAAGRQETNETPILKTLTKDVLSLLPRYLSPADQASFRGTCKTITESAPYDFRGEVTVSYENCNNLRRKHGPNPFKHTARLQVFKPRDVEQQQNPIEGHWDFIGNLLREHPPYNFEFGLIISNSRRTETHLYWEVDLATIRRESFIKLLLKRIVYTPLEFSPIELLYIRTPQPSNPRLRLLLDEAEQALRPPY